MIQKFLSLSLLVLLSQVLQAQTVTIYGAVRDADTDAALTDASLVLSGTEKIAASTAGGAYSLDNVTPGVYNLVVTHVGYLPQEIRVEAKAGAAVRTDILLRRDQTNTPTPTVTESPPSRLKKRKIKRKAPAK